MGYDLPHSPQFYSLAIPASITFLFPGQLIFTVVAFQA